MNSDPFLCCPFCGCSECFIRDEGGIAYGVCPGCGTEGPQTAVREHALNQWNKRSSVPQDREKGE